MYFGRMYLGVLVTAIVVQLNSEHLSKCCLYEHMARDQKPGSTHGLSCPLSPLTPRPLSLSPQRNLNMTACTSEEGKGAA